MIRDHLWPLTFGAGLAHGCTVFDAIGENLRTSAVPINPTSDPFSSKFAGDTAIAVRL